MPQVKAEYEAVPEFDEIASALVNKYPEVFPAVDISKIKCVAIVNKSRAERRKEIWTMTPVPMPIRMDCPFAWYVQIYMQDWIEMSLPRRQMMVASVLCAIPEDGEEGKTQKPDLKDYGVMVRTFGVDYMDGTEERYKDLLAENVQWITK